MKMKSRHLGLSLAVLTALVPATLLPTTSRAAGGAGTGAGDGTGGGKGTLVLNTYNKVLPKLIGDALGPKDATGYTIAKNTGSGFMDPQIKLDDSPSATLDYANKVPLLIAVTRTSNTAVTANNGDTSYMQGGFAVVNLTPTKVDDANMKYVELPNLTGERNFQKPNIVATDKHYIIIGASEDNGANNNPQIVAFAYDKVTLKMVPITNSGREAGKPINLNQISGKQDNEQYGPHSIARVAGPAGLASNAFVMGVQRNNANAYVMRFDVAETAAGVSFQVKYLTEVVANAQHCRPDVVTSVKNPGKVYLTTVEGNKQPADKGVRVLAIDSSTGTKIKDEFVAQSVAAGTQVGGKDAEKYAVQPNIADINEKFLAVTFQYSEKVRNVTKDANNNDGHSGNSNLSMLQLIDKVTMKPVGAPMAAVAPYARHAAVTSLKWGPEDKVLPAIMSLGGSSTGTGKGLAQIIPFDETTGSFGGKDPNKLYELSRYSDVAGLVVRGKRNPNNQGRGFIYAVGDVPNPGFGKGPTGFMPEVKTFVASALQGYTDSDSAAKARRQSIWLSLVPAVWEKEQVTVPGNATETPGTGPDGAGSLPRTAEKPTVAKPVVPPVDVDDFAASAEPGLPPATGCGCNAGQTSGESGIASLLLGAIALVSARRSARRRTNSF
jgi:hypothetical protein